MTNKNDSDNKRHSYRNSEREENAEFNGHHHHQQDDGDVQPEQNEKSHINEKNNEYIKECLLEKSRMEKQFPIAAKLIDIEIEKVQSTGRIPSREPRYADIYRERPIRVSQKVLVPVREHPKFNFVGKILGPKGNSLRRLQEETLCKITVLGRNSMKDRVKEEELRASMDPKYAHLNSDLHVEISTIAPPAEAYARIAYAMAELRKYLIPDSNDTIRQEQLRELMVENPNMDFEGKSGYKKPPAGTSQAPMSSTSGRSSYKSNIMPSSNPRTNTAVPPKQKVLSILDKARSAMEESYNASRRHYEEQQHVYEQPATYENHYYQPSTANRPPYEQMPEYEQTDYRRNEYYSHSSTGHPVNAANGMIGHAGAANSNAVNNINHNRNYINR